MLDNQGRIVLGGRRSFLRYLSNGQIDNSFGINGQLIRPDNVFDNGLTLFPGTTELLIDGADRILALAGTGANFFLRVDDNGNFDTTLSDDGIQRPELFGGVTQFADFGIDNNGRLITVGNDSDNVFVTRYVTT